MNAPQPADDEPHRDPAAGSAIGARVDLGGPEDEPEQTQGPDPPSTPRQREGGSPASFWRRLGAYAVDSIVLAVPVNLLVELAMGRPVPTDLDLAAPAETLEAIWPFSAIALALEVAYFAGMESSKLQATIGKHLLKLQVTDEQGERLSLLRAAARNLGKLVSALPFGLGFLLIFTSERNQALHDHLARALVLERGEGRERTDGPNLEDPERGWDR